MLVSLEQSLASQLLSHLDRSAVEMVTWEIARLDRVDADERTAVFEEFYGLGLRRLCFVFEDLVKMSDADIRAAFHEEDRRTWALALAGAAATVRAKVLGALSSSSAAALRQHLDNLGPFRLSDSEAAQLEVAERLRRFTITAGLAFRSRMAATKFWCRRNLENDSQSAHSPAPDPGSPPSPTATREPMSGPECLRDPGRRVVRRSGPCGAGCDGRQSPGAHGRLPAIAIRVAPQ